MGETMTDYFPRTASEDQGYYSEEMADEIVPNGAAPPPNEPTKTKGMPNKMSLKLSHLPSKKDIKVVYPRTPSSVCIYILHYASNAATRSHATRTSRRIYAAYRPVYGLGRPYMRWLRLLALPSGCDAIVLTRYLQIDPNNPPWPAFRGYHTFVTFFLSIGCLLTLLQVLVRVCHYGAPFADHSREGHRRRD